MKEFMALNNNLKLRMLTVFLAVMLSSSVGPNMTIYYAKYFGASITGVLLIIVSALALSPGCTAATSPTYTAANRSWSPDPC
ncbi:hypothetical protein [Lacticaseibacillus camelliae]|uniref:hypothetical protein n=1 Tax=Lacticaseibacillus camelliae TaxID=381742 RepID=UPI000A94C7BA|nr:hypothetical protein [Lacticaseibacillus camelliae]